MIFEQIPAGGDRNFAYLLGDEESKQAAIIDASYDPRRALQAAQERGLAVRYVISTHSHPDHVAGNDQVVQATGAQEVMHSSAPRSSAVRVEDEQTIALGNLPLKFFHTPGHIPDHICVLADGHLITGDLLFVGKVGGTGAYFQGSDPLQQWNSLRRLMTFPHHTSVWPGHDYGVRPHSTIGDEIAGNPFLKCRSFEEFTHLKANWAEYKKLHNIT
jgi:glyoxylase-like metal-dependent hydrolase (beta-lactamase superfamily II)